MPTISILKTLCLSSVGTMTPTINAFLKCYHCLKLSLKLMMSVKLFLVSSTERLHLLITRSPQRFSMSFRKTTQIKTIAPSQVNLRHANRKLQTQPSRLMIVIKSKVGKKETNAPIRSMPWRSKPLSHQSKLMAKRMEKMIRSTIAAQSKLRSLMRHYPTLRLRNR